MKQVLRILIGLLVLIGCAIFANTNDFNIAESVLFPQGVNAKCSLSVFKDAQFGAFTADGKRFAIQEGTQIKLYGINQTKTQKCQTLLNEVKGTFVAFSPKGTMLVVGIGDFDALQLYKTADQKPLGGLFGGHFEAFNENETRFVVSDSVREKGKEIDRKVVLYNAANQKQVGSDIRGSFAGVDKGNNRFMVTRQIENGFMYSWYNFDTGDLLSEDTVSAGQGTFVAESLYAKMQSLKVAIGVSNDVLYSIDKKNILYPQGYQLGQPLPAKKETLVGVTAQEDVALFKSGNQYTAYGIGLQKTIFTITTQATFAAFNPQGTLLVFNTGAAKYEFYSGIDGSLIMQMGGIFQGFSADGSVFAAHEPRWDRIIMYENIFFKELAALQKTNPSLATQKTFLLKALAGLVSEYPDRKMGEGAEFFVLNAEQKKIFETFPAWLVRVLKPYVYEDVKKKPTKNFKPCEESILNQQLLDAVEKNNAQAVEQLITDGACVNIVAAQGVRKGLTPLMIATIKGSAAIATALLQASDIEVNQQDQNSGRTALMWGVAKQRTAMVELLLKDDRMDVTIKGKEDNTALMLAQKSGFSKIVKLFE